MKGELKLRIVPRGLLGALWIAIALLAAGSCAESPPPPPAQPIAFSHETHAQEEIDCVRCHQGVESQAEAGLPPLSSCAVCHRRRAIPDHPEVVKFMEVLEEGGSLKWRKVNVIPEAAMVHFRHNAHSRAGVECETCHGDVSRMTVAQEVIETSDMGWCVSCHRQSDASVDCLTCHH